MLQVKVYTTKIFPVDIHSKMVYQVAFLVRDKVRDKGRSIMVQGREAIPFATRHPRLPSRREAIHVRVLSLGHKAQGGGAVASLRFYLPPAESARLPLCI